MKSLQLIRDKFNLTQDQMAEYLGISRVQVAHVERGSRTLTDEAFNRLTKLAQLSDEQARQGKLYCITENLQSRIREKEEKIIKKMQARERQCRFQADRYTLQLNEMETVYQRTQLWYAAVLEMNEKVPDENVRVQTWLNIQLHEAEERLLKNGKIEQMKIKGKIFVLEAESEFNKSVLRDGIEKKPIPDSNEKKRLLLPRRKSEEVVYF